MSGLHFWLFVVAASTALFVAHGYDVDSILEKIPEGERKAFLKHHISLGYELSNVDITRNKKIPQDLKELPVEFSMALYEKFRKYHLIPKGGAPSTRENIICFPNGECIDIDDPGVHPMNMI